MADSTASKSSSSIRATGRDGRWTDHEGTLVFEDEAGKGMCLLQDLNSAPFSIRAYAIGALRRLVAGSDRSYADTVAHAFHPGRCMSTRIEVAVDGAGHSTSKIAEIAEFRTVEKVEMISGGHPYEVTFAGYPNVHCRWTGDTTLIVRTTEAKDL